MVRWCGASGSSSPSSVCRCCCLRQGRCFLGSCTGQRCSSAATTTPAQLDHRRHFAVGTALLLKVNTSISPRLFGDIPCLPSVCHSAGAADTYWRQLQYHSGYEARVSWCIVNARCMHCYRCGVRCPHMPVRKT